RAGVMILNDRRSAKEEAGAKPGGVDNEWAQAYKKLPKCFGNEVRGCSIRARSYVSTENGQIWGDVIRHTWAEKGRTCPITPVPGTEAAISISESLQWASYPDEPKLDDYPPSTRWNLLAENMITRCPVGVLIGKAVDKTILDGNSFYECGEPVKDLGRNTVNLDSFVHNASKEKTALAPQK
ncbi:MAG: hypothetical protein Q8O57_09245, partial [Kiritimatiellota bacterium]|nr:hypothetical protein [Kiritimatiellota bacterium]